MAHPFREKTDPAAAPRPEQVKPARRRLYPERPSVGIMVASRLARRPKMERRGSQPRRKSVGGAGKRAIPQILITMESKEWLNAHGAKNLPQPNQPFRRMVVGEISVRLLTRGSRAPCNAFASGSYAGPFCRSSHPPMTLRYCSKTDPEGGLRTCSAAA